MEEAWAGDSLLAFDGRVLEVFGFSGSQSVRFHARNMELDIGEPDRKGTRLVTLKAAGAVRRHRALRGRGRLATRRSAARPRAGRDARVIGRATAAGG